MRDILFRARDYNENWRYGNLCRYIGDSNLMFETNEYYTIREQDPDCEEEYVV